MPTLAFFPWARLDRPCTFGDFRLVPLAQALSTGLVPSELHAAVTAILQGYGHVRPVDRASVALLHRADLPITGELSDADVADYYEFRTRLAFAMLSRREYFDFRYCSSESLELVIRSYTPESRGGVVVEHRRRDGARRILYSEGTFLQRKPDYVEWCALDRDMDADVLHALERVADSDDATWDDIAEALRVFVRANSDSPAVDVQSELVDLVSAFSRLVNQWKEPETVRAFLKLLPPPGDPPKKDFTGPKVRHPRIWGHLRGGWPLRGPWLRDAFLLRHSYGHGRVLTPKVTPVWTVHEHLLFGAWAFPLTVKARLAELGHYQLSREDVFRDAALEHLLEVEPFIHVPRCDPSGNSTVTDIETWTRWEDTMSDLRMRFATDEILRLWRERGDLAGEDPVVGSTSLSEDDFAPLEEDDCEHGSCDERSGQE